ncbi:tubulin tyrosine ligase-like 15 isoform 2-T5 [Glossina fuscipes fuscipes]
MQVGDAEFREVEKHKISPKIVTSTIPAHSVFIFLLTVVLTALVVELLPPNCTYWDWATNEFILPESVPTYAVYGKSPNEEHLLHVAKVLQRLGYKRIALQNEWDLLWAHDYPFFKMTNRLKDLTNQQIVNHVPGCGFITNKVDLSTTELTFLPKAFRLPSQREDFLNYAQRSPNALFVQKHNEHRHILIRPVKDINLQSNDTFVQEFIQKPFLVDGYKFDIGVYVIVTGIDPLRLYIYTGDVLFRYCSVKYYPFNASNIDSYVVGDDYLPTWQVPSLVKYYEHLDGNMRDSFDAYVRDQYSDPSIIWLQVEGIIRETVLAKEQQIAGILRSYKNLNFFELMRFDFIIDEDLRVYLMEANMSPNLSSGHFKPNALLYEQILYSAFSLVGVSSLVRGTLSESFVHLVTLFRLRYVNRKGVALPTSSEATKRAKRENLELKQILAPELCTVHPIPASLWRTAVCLPCILYRINGLLLADNIRKKVVADIGLGQPELPEDQDSPMLDFGWSLSDVLEKSKINESAKTKQEDSLDQIIKDCGKKVHAFTLNGEESEIKIESKTINEIVEDAGLKLKEECGAFIEIGTWSNDMANYAIKDDDTDSDYDDLLDGIIPPFIKFPNKSHITHLY